jgi:hypothetical protein
MRQNYTHKSDSYSAQKKLHFSNVTPVNSQREATSFPTQASVPLISLAFDHISFQSFELSNGNIINCCHYAVSYTSHKITPWPEFACELYP